MNREDSFSLDFDGGSQWPFNARRRDLLPGEKTINIYAAAPLTNNDDIVEAQCLQFREILKRVFEPYDFEGISFRVYDPAEETRPGSLHSADDVYAINYEQCVKSDVIVYHVTAPSLGVGCESQIAADATVPRVVVAKADASVSRMFEGVFSSTIQTIQFANEHDLELQLVKRRHDIANAVVSSATMRRPLLSEFAELELGRIVFRQRILQRVSLNDLAMQTDGKEAWLYRLERNPILAACCSAMLLNRIAAATNCNVQTLGPNLTTLRPRSDELETEQKESLENLVNYIFSKDRRVEDERIFALWHEYAEEYQREVAEAVEYREGGTRALTTDDWRRRDSGGSGQLF